VGTASGGGGAGGGSVAGTAGTANTGGGGGGGGYNPSAGQAGGTGGSGIIVVRTPSATSGSVSATPGTNTVTSAPCGAQVATFTVSGSLVVSQY
jgi:hypothetical protein